MDNEKEKIRKMKDEAIRKGGIFAKLYFQIFGNSKEATLDLAKGFSASLVKAPGVKLGAVEIEEVIEDNGYFSTYLTSYLVFSSFESFLNILAQYTPFSFEIVEPEKVVLEKEKLNNILYDLVEYIFSLKVKVFEENAKESQKMKMLVKHRLELGKRLKQKQESKEKDKEESKEKEKEGENG